LIVYIKLYLAYEKLFKKYAMLCSDFIVFFTSRKYRVTNTLYDNSKYDIFEIQRSTLIND